MKVLACFLCAAISAVAMAASEPSVSVPAIAVAEPTELLAGQLTLLAFCHNGNWIKNSFAPKVILRFPDGISYEEIKAKHKNMIPVHSGRKRPLTVDVASTDGGAEKELHTVYFKYTAEQYAGIQDLGESVFVACNAPEIHFKTVNLFATEELLDSACLALMGTFEGPGELVEKFKEEVKAEDLEGERYSHQLFVTAGPTNAVATKVSMVPGLEKCLERGKKSLVKLLLHEHQELLKDAERTRNSYSDVEGHIKDLEFVVATIESKAAMMTPYNATEDELREIKTNEMLGGYTEKEKIGILPYLYSIRQMCPETKDMSNMDLLAKIARLQMDNRYFDYKNDDDALKYFRGEIERLKEQNMDKKAAEEDLLAELKNGLNLDPALYTTQTRVTRFSLPGIFTGAFLYVAYVYPKDRLPAHVLSLSGNYMAILETSDATQSNILWEEASDYDPAVDCTSGVVYEFDGICDVNQNSAPEILMRFGGHEFWGVELYEWTGKQFCLISKSEGGI